MASIFLNDEDTRNLVMPKLDDENYSIEENWFGGKFDEKTLVGHCFDVPYIKDTVTDTRALITMESYVSKIENEQIKEITLDIFAYSHKENVDMNYKEKSGYEEKGYAGNRVDMMVQAMCNSIKNTRHIKSKEQMFGIGDIQLCRNNPITPYLDEKFHGKKIHYVIKDFYMKNN